MTVKKHLRTSCLIFLQVCRLCAGCAAEEVPGIVRNTPGSDQLLHSTDYSDTDNWLVRPDSPDKAVDLIYFYPTSFSPADRNISVISDIGGAGMRSAAAPGFDFELTAPDFGCSAFTLVADDGRVYLGRNYHCYITDASGDGRVVEFDCDQEDRLMVVTPIRSITNYFGMYEDIVVPGPNNGKYGTGKERRDRIEETIEAAGDKTDHTTVLAALRSASTAPDPESIISNTQWSIVYNLTDLSHEFVLHRDWDNVFFFKTVTR